MTEKTIQHWQLLQPQLFYRCSHRAVFRIMARSFIVGTQGFPLLMSHGQGNTPDPIHCRITVAWPVCQTVSVSWYSSISVYLSLLIHHVITFSRTYSLLPLRHALPAQQTAELRSTTPVVPPSRSLCLADKYRISMNIHQQSLPLHQIYFKIRI